MNADNADYYTLDCRRNQRLLCAGALAAPTPRPGYTTHAARRVTAPGGAHWSTGWGSAARLPLGLDPRRRMG